VGDRERPRKSGFLPFLAAILLAAALLALIGWQAAPWHGHPSIPESGIAADNTQSSAGGQPGTSQSGKPSGEKPSPMPAAPASRAALPGAQPGVSDCSPSAAPAPQPVTVISSPGGATATIDGRSDTACKTPCELDALPGQHSISIFMPGYQIERRDATVGNSPLELEAVILHATAGTLMLSSAPPGATIRINGKTVGRVTPAQLSLAPGTYKVTVEKDGASKTTDVDIHNDETKLLKVILGQ
jgi:hypothetical protein